MKHGIAAHKPDSKRPYFGWPSVAVTDSGKIVAVASGMRRCHVDPFGKTVMCVSRDGGQTWDAPKVINDSPLDDRDAGVICLGGEKLLVTWFSSVIDEADWYMRKVLSVEDYAEAIDTLRANSKETQESFRGAWYMRSMDGGETWETPRRCPVNTPHGPTRRSDGRLFYFGKGFPTQEFPVEPAIMAYESLDDGETWTHIGTVPEPDDLTMKDMHEPHAIAYEDGYVIGTIRMEYPHHECTYSTRSYDGGKTWTKPEPTGIECVPVHLCPHSSGALAAVYSWRHAPYGQRARVSYDRGLTWGPEIILRDDGPSWDLGYPCTVELPDKSLLTLYYQPTAEEPDFSSLLYTIWTLNEVK